jgi:hypothetical protein
MLDPAAGHALHRAVIDARQFGPVPPLGSHVKSDTAAWIFLAANTAIFLAGTLYAIRDAWRQRMWIPVLCMLGGVLCVFTESMVDSHLQVWWPIHSQPDTFSAFGRHVPLMVVPIVGWYFGLGTYVRWALLQRYGARLPVWLVYLGEVAAAICLEPPAIQLHLWHYYGQQGLRFFGYPIWWPFVGGACGVLAGTLIYKLTPYLKGPRALLTPILVPMGVVAVYWAAGLPMFNQLNKDPSAHWISYLVAPCSIGLAMVIVWICTIATGHHAHRLAAKQAKAAGGRHTRVLVLANRTAATPALIDAVRRRAEQGPAEFTLLVPYVAHGHDLSAPLEDSDSHAVLDLALPLLEQAAGKPVAGQIGDRNPMKAIVDATAPDISGERPYDEVIISTLSPRVSSWLRSDLPDAVRGLGLPVTTITAAAHQTTPIPTHA